MIRLLIVAQYIAPTQSIASIRWTKLAKYLRQTGAYQISVLTNEKHYHSADGNAASKDALLEKEMGIFFRYNVIPDSDALKRYYAIKYRHSVYLHRDHDANVPADPSASKRMMYEALHDIKDQLQFFQAKAYLRSHPELLECDVLITSYDPLWPHLTGEWIAKRNPAIRWIADFRDPYRSSMTPQINRIYRRHFEKKHVGCASLVTTVSPELLPMLSLRQGQYTLVLPNGYDPEEAIPPAMPRKFALVYTGTLYSSGVHRSDLTPLFASLAAQIESGVIQRKDVVLQYAGQQGGLFAEQASQYGLGDRVEDLGFLSRQEAAIIRSQAAGLILCTWNTGVDQGIVTGKLYEYMLARKPVFAICTGNQPYSRVYSIFQKTGIGYCCETCRPETLDQLREALTAAYLSWKDTGMPAYTPDDNALAEFSYPALAGVLHRVIARL